MTKEEAIEFYSNGCWKKMTYHEKVAFQLFEDRLCMPFAIFHEALEKVVARSVETLEFAVNIKGLQKEFVEKTTESKQDGYKIHTRYI